ncbi:MAG: hypothetical protein II557_12225 [Clostridia bacterium]|nr:hypothetical protein [Clostridia bacterium]
MKPETKKRPPILRVLKGILLFLLIAVLLAAAAVFVLPLCEGVSRAPVEGSADWMAALDDSTPLNLVTLPGTHNAGAANAQLAFFSKCQSLGIRAQLEAGYRYLDIRLGKDEADGELILKHGFTNCKPSALSSRALTLAEAAADCCAFLDAHPTEAVLFCVKHEHGDFPISEMQTLLAAECAKAPERWFLSDTLPTVGEARGKIVLLRRYGDDAGLGEAAGIPFAWTDQGGLADPVEDAEANMPGELLLWVQDRYEYDAEDKWYSFLAGLSIGIGDGEAAVHFLSTKGSLAYGHPFWFARTLNRRLLRYGLPVGEPLGWIIVDFGSAKLAEHVWRCNFS